MLEWQAMTDQPRLKKSVSLFGVIAYGMGTAIGVSIFSVIAPAAQMAGSALPFAVILAIIPMGILAVVYSFISSALPVSGASYEWPRRMLGPGIGFMIAWTRITSSVSSLLILGVVLGDYLGFASDWQKKILSGGLFTILAIANFLGIGVSARIQQLLFIILLSVCGIFIAVGLPHVSWHHVVPLQLPHGLFGVIASLSVLVNLFLGVEVATEVGEEVKDGRKTVPRALAISMISALCLYLAIAIVAEGNLGWQGVARSHKPLLDAVQAFMGPWGGTLIIIAAMASTTKSLNGIFIIFTRYLYAMGRSGALPKILGRVQPRFRTPHMAVLAAYLFCLAGLAFPSDLTDLFLGNNIPTLFKYISTCCSAIAITRFHPAIYESAQFKPGRRAVQIWAILGIAAALGILAIGLTLDTKPYVLLTLWAAIGAIYYVLRVRGRPRPARN